MPDKDHISIPKSRIMEWVAIAAFGGTSIFGLFNHDTTVVHEDTKNVQELEDRIDELEDRLRDIEYGYY